MNNEISFHNISANNINEYRNIIKPSFSSPPIKPSVYQPKSPVRTSKTHRNQAFVNANVMNVKYSLGHS